MRPRGTKHKWVKVLPWYFVDARQPSRQDDLRRAVADDLAADAPPPPQENDQHE